MKKATTIFVALAGLLALNLPAQNAPVRSAGRHDTLLLAVEGRVETAASGTAAWSLARTNQALRAGDRVRTGLRSRATIRLSDLSVLRVNELTTLEIRPPEQQGRPQSLELKSGAIYFFNRERPADVQFRTPIASGAIRGTEFHLFVEANGRTVLTMLDGLVDLSAAGGQINLASGEQGIVEAGQPPRKTAVLDAINIIQWALYYPGVLDPDELSLTDEARQSLTASLAAYRSGDLLAAQALYPENRQPASDAERIYRAATLLAVGQVDAAEALLKATPSTLADALREVIAVVKNQKWERTAPPATASEWMAESYSLQTRSRLADALKAAQAAAQKSPNFGFASARVAELEFSFGRTDAARKALDKALQLSPRNAQAVALRGFVFAAQNKIDAALAQFESAIALDGALGNAWLGRGLCKIRQGRGEEGRADLQVAATLEPQRAILRSYLGKAWSNTRDNARAEKELKLAQKLDPNDPTSWLYSALLHQQNNRINEAVRDLEKSQDLNDNRSLFRSRLLLDQDQAVRGANLAGIYRDAGMFDVALREASRAVSYDYANSSAHLFLARSYNALLDPKRVSLRYETPYLSELFVANLLAPVGAANLSQTVSQNEFSKLLQRDGLGLSSSTEYSSRGEWVQKASQYGTFGGTAYAIDAQYFSSPGWRPNNDVEETFYSVGIKQQLTPQDSVMLQVNRFERQAGDLAYYYDPTNASRSLRISEKQEPNVYLGYHREWSPGVHTLFLGGRLHDQVRAGQERIPFFTFNRSGAGAITNVVLSPFNPNSAKFNDAYEREFVVYSAELQQLWQKSAHTVILGGRYQRGEVETSDLLTFVPGSAFTSNYRNPPASTNFTSDLERVNAYAYYFWQVADPLQLCAGLSYDRLHYPVNTDFPPLSSAETGKDQISPKAGFLWTPAKNTTVRFAYTRSLGGLFHDGSVRLEPVQFAGFLQAYRSLVPESFLGPIPGSRFETFGLALDQRLSTGTYLGVMGEILNSEAVRTIGAFDKTGPLYIVNLGGSRASPSSTRERFDYTEKALTFYANQLLSDEFALGARYRLTHSSLKDTFLDVPAGAARNPSSDTDALLHQVNLYLLYQHRCGFFAQFDALWTAQSNHGQTPALPGDDFWQLNLSAGYRFARRHAEVRVGVVNLTDTNYRLNPLSLYSELPRERAFVASFKFWF